MHYTLALMQPPLPVCSHHSEVSLSVPSTTLSENKQQPINTEGDCATDGQEGHICRLALTVG